MYRIYVGLALMIKFVSSHTYSESMFEIKLRHAEVDLMNINNKIADLSVPDHFFSSEVNTYCGLQCDSNSNCTTFTVCDGNSATCYLLREISEFQTLNISGQECVTYGQVTSAVFSCNGQGQWQFKTRSCQCVTGRCGTYCEIDCSAVTETLEPTTQETVTPEPCPSSANYTLDLTLNMCYKVVKTRKNWPDANATCQQDGGMLLKMHTEQRWQFWKTLAPTLDDLGYGFWIGGNDLVTEGVWVWSDGTLFSDYALNKWGAIYAGAWVSEPNNYDNKDHCLRFYLAVHPHYPAFPETNYMWHDDWCFDVTLYYICEIVM